MRTWLTFLALAGFLPQQFTCCAESCGPCSEPTANHAAESPCSHHDEHDHEAPPGPHEHSPHHLCVVTHLFYLSRSDAGSLVPDWSTAVAIPTAPYAMIGLQADGPYAVLASHAVPPCTGGTLRALLSVWII